MSEFLFKFDELPLAIVDDVEAAYISGAAEVHYTRDGLASISHIYLEGFGERDANGKRKWPLVAAPQPLEQVIRHRLLNEWSSRVRNAVCERIEQDIEEAA